jgi:DNA polymerase (family 10)
MIKIWLEEMKNQMVADILYQIADLLGMQGVEFKPRAYRRAAQNIEVLDRDIQEVYEIKELQSIPGVGKAIEKKIIEIVETGKLKYLEELEDEIPAALSRFTRIPGIGPRTALLLYKELKITDIDALKEACSAHKLKDVKGLGEKTEENILRGIKMLESARGRILLGNAYENGKQLLVYIKNFKDVLDANIAGSLRRMRETIGDVDILASSYNPQPIMAHFVGYPEAAEILVKGDTKTSIILTNGIQVDLRVVKPESYGAALQYFTGSKEHNIKLRKLAIKKGLKINEYGVFKRDANERIAGRTEEEVYGTLGLPYIEPELREDRGEIALAQENRLPNIINYNEVHGDFHVHSTWSDGSSSIEELILSAKNRGYNFIAITDHSQSLKIANGLSIERLLKQIKQINKLNEKLEDFRIFAGTECDILPDGSLDYPDKILKELDFVIGAVHSRFKMEKNEMTERLVKAVENEYLKILAHPTGRIIGKREPYELDLEKVIQTAKDNDTLLEINAFPDRLDLKDTNAKLAKEIGAKIAIGTDAHNVTHLRYMHFGVATARRGWLNSTDVLNAYPLDKIEKILT